MRQISAVFTKTTKELYRNKTTVFWTVIWPIVFLFLGIFVFYRGVPQELVPQYRAGITISMIVFSLMISGMSTMPAIIAQDRVSGLFLKLRSMPVRQWKDIIGRIFGLLFYVLISAILIGILGVALGAKFNFTPQSIFISIGFLILATLSASGVGIIIGTFIKNINGAIITGVAIAVVTMSLAGITFPYSFLPAALQGFSRFYPFSSSNAVISYLLSTQEFVGYNPMSPLQIIYTITLSVVLFIVSLILYSKFCWRAD